MSSGQTRTGLERLDASVLADRHTLAHWGDKAIAPAWYGRTWGEIIAAGIEVTQLPTPCLTLDQQALTANLDAFHRWCAGHRVQLSPHGKTTMAPALWAHQLRAGAWGITVAGESQLRVALAVGVPRVMVANLLLRAEALSWLAGWLDEHPEQQVVVWADSVDAVAVMTLALRVAAPRRRLPVLVELGHPGGRTGARTLGEALAVARAVAAATQLDLAGVAGYEGVLAESLQESGQRVIDGFLRDLAELFETIAPMCQVDEPIITAGGSTWFDRVVDILGPLREHGACVVLRSGAYLAHDDGFYARATPAVRVGQGPVLRSAMHVWARVIANPEPGLILLDAGKRDVPYDLGLPSVQVVRRAHGLEPVTEHLLTATNDQHSYVSYPTQTPLRVGDVVRLGLSHPCTAFDKWSAIPVISNADDPRASIVDIIRTHF